MKKSQLRQIIKEEISKVLNKSVNEAKSLASDYDSYALVMYKKRWDDLDNDEQTEVVDAVEGNWSLARIEREYKKRRNESVKEGLRVKEWKLNKTIKVPANDKLGSRYNWKTHLTPIYHDISKKLNLNIDDVSGYLNLVGA